MRPCASHESALPPGPPLPAPIQTYLMWRWPLAFLDACRSRYGDRFTHRAFRFPPLVFLSAEEDLRAAFGAPADTLQPGRGADVIAPIVGDASFMLDDGASHRTGRKAILSAFRASTVKHSESSIDRIVRRAVNSWPRYATVPLQGRLRALTLEIILRRIFGSSPQMSQDRLSALRDALLEAMAVTGGVLLLEPALRRGPGQNTWQRFLGRREKVDRLLYGLIDERLSAPETGDDLLAHLIRAGQLPPMSRKRLRDDLMSVILAGHETTAAELAWALQLLTYHRRSQDRLAREIRRGEDDRYLRATVQEVLRTRPVFLFAIGRHVEKTVTIGDHTYHPPMHLMPCIYLRHHDPNLYPEPHAFRPERFMEQAPQPHAWLPWGGGQKRCPGLHLATLEMRAVLRALLASAEVLPAAKQMERPRWRSVIITPHAGCQVVLQPLGRKDIR